jgi:type IV pilus assembly protein PilC
MLIFDAITNVARGEPVSKSFQNHWAFPIVAYEMLVTGERTGQPGPMMDKVAEYYQEEHKNAINSVKTFIEPALIVFLAVVVGIILLAVVLPMFDIYGQIGVQGT